MEIEKLIEKLRDAGWTNPGLTDKQSLEWDAATALERLQAENDRLKQERDAAVAGLQGCCDACQHYTPEHGNDICGSYVYEYPLFYRDGVVIEDTAGNGLELRR